MPQYDLKEGRSQEQLISIEQMHIVYNQTKTGVLGNGLAAVLLGTVLWEINDHAAIISWLAFVVSVLIARYVLYALNQRSESADENPIFWVRVYSLFAFLSGAAWGQLGYCFSLLNQRFIMSLYACGFWGSVLVV